MEAQDYDALIAACIQHGDASAGGDPQLWAEALEYLSTQPGRKGPALNQGVQTPGLCAWGGLSCAVHCVHPLHGRPHTLLFQYMRFLLTGMDVCVELQRLVSSCGCKVCMVMLLQVTVRLPSVRCCST